MGMKAGAYLLTGSVGLLSDALELLVNLAGAIMVLSMLSVAARPADDNHTYGHSKAEYFSSGFEGSLILIAAASIIYTAVKRLDRSPAVGTIRNRFVGIIDSLDGKPGGITDPEARWKTSQCSITDRQFPSPDDRCVDVRWCAGGRGCGCHHWLATTRLDRRDPGCH